MQRPLALTDQAAEIGDKRLLFCAKASGSASWVCQEAEECARSHEFHIVSGLSIADGAAPYTGHEIAQSTLGESRNLPGSYHRHRSADCRDKPAAYLAGKIDKRRPRNGHLAILYWRRCLYLVREASQPGIGT